ncbi:ankyrin-1 [Caerostris extrusa]|uniref:Ankyrin-1 n=1 Tax=Caerostris extrusa TaxID=172846 RepID=A0AAV4WQ32_CAEEX|nr:ankyrin-1 [Caerostris extrusa]
MLLLDILSISEAQLTRNPFYLDSGYPLHIEIWDNSNRKIDKIIKCDTSKLEKTHCGELSIVINQQKLFIALENDNMQQVEECIRAGADIFGRDLRNVSCLHFSAKAPNTNAIEFALEQGLSINSKDNDGQTALHVASKFNRLKTVKYLVEVKHFLINGRDVNGKGREDVVKVLLDHEANVSACDDGVFPLHFFCSWGHIKVLKLLLDKNADVNIQTNLGLTPLHYAAQNGHHDLAIMLLDHKALIDRALFGDLPFVEYCIQKHDNDINAKNNEGETSLHLASRGNFQHVVSFLIDKGAEIDAKDNNGHTALYFTCINNYKDVVHILINKQTKDYKERIQLLIIAVIKAYNDIVNILFQNTDFDVAELEHEYHLLHEAVRAGHRMIVENLFKRRFQIDTERDSSTPAYFSTIQASFNRAIFCYQRVPIKQLKIKEGRTPLHFSSSIR